MLINVFKIIHHGQLFAVIVGGDGLQNFFLGVGGDDLLRLNDRGVFFRSVVSEENTDGDGQDSQRGHGGGDEGSSFTLFLLDVLHHSARQLLKIILRNLIIFSLIKIL